MSSKVNNVGKVMGHIFGWGGIFCDVDGKWKDWICDVLHAEM